MTKYKTIYELRHNGETYAPETELELEDKFAQPLLEIKAISLLADQNIGGNPPPNVPPLTKSYEEMTGNEQISFLESVKDLAELQKLKGDSKVVAQKVIDKKIKELSE